MTAIGVLSALSASAPTIHAAGAPGDPPAEIFARERPTTRSFYGWQILASGGVGGLVAAASVVLTDSPLKSFPSAFGFIAGTPLYVLGGPATHWTHGEFKKGLLSFGGNFVLPLAGGFIGQAINCAPNDSDNCGARGFFSGLAVALVTAPVLDALVLGWEDIPDDDPESPVASPPVQASTEAAKALRRGVRAAPSFTMLPAWNLGPKGEVSFGVMGRF
jgi:hypothetical protein